MRTEPLITGLCHRLIIGYRYTAFIGVTVDCPLAQTPDPVCATGLFRD